VVPGFVLALFAAICALNVWTTWRIARDDLSTPRQRLAQVAVAWLLPVAGALLVLRVQERNPKVRSGQFGDGLGYGVGWDGPVESEAGGFREFEGSHESGAHGGDSHG